MSERFLEQLLESSVKAKCLRLFLHHPDEWIGAHDARRRIQADKKSVERVLEKLNDLNLLRRRTVRLSKKERSSRRGRTPLKEKRYSVNTSFPFYEELCQFVLRSRPTTATAMRRHIQKVGNVKLAVLAGSFVQDKAARADVLLVGTDFREKRVNNLIKKFEAEYGHALRCVVMTADQFEYRYGLFDRFVRDLVHGDNEVLIDRLGVTEA